MHLQTQCGYGDESESRLSASVCHATLLRMLACYLGQVASPAWTVAPENTPATFTAAVGSNFTWKCHIWRESANCLRSQCMQSFVMYYWALGRGAAHLNGFKKIGSAASLGHMPNLCVILGEAQVSFHKTKISPGPHATLLHTTLQSWDDDIA